METAVVWLLVIGPLLIGLGAAIWWGSGNNTVGLWGGFVPGAIALVFAAAFQVHTLISKPENHAATLAKPENRDRPWIALDIDLAGPLAYDAAGWSAGLRWHIPLKYELKNTGNSPALEVDIFAEMMPFMISVYPPDSIIKDGFPQGTPTKLTDSAAELKRMCATFANLKKFFKDGRTLFRDKTISGVLEINGDPAKFESAKNTPGYSGNFLILVCASYRFTGEDELHHTADAFALYRPNGKIDIAGETIPVQGLRIAAQPMGGAFAD